MVYLDYLFRISICFILGIVIGLERQYRRKTTGIRTITLVALGSFLFVSISELTNPNDISRVAAQVVSGIGFLGAGVILRDGKNVRGLNTAATLWCSAAIGTLTALNLIIEAVIGVVFILLCNMFLRYISKLIMKKVNSVTEYYSLSIECDKNSEMAVKNLLVQKAKVQGNKIKNFTSNKSNGSVKIQCHLEVIGGVESVNEIVNRLCIEPGVNSAEYLKISSYEDDDDDYEEQ